MAAQIIHNNKNHHHEVSKQDIQAIFANVEELRTLHSALKQGNSTANLRFLNSGSTLSRPSHFSAKDYPIFTPSYEEEPLPAYQHIRLENQNFSEIFNWYKLQEQNDEAHLTDNQETSSNNGQSSGLYSRGTPSFPGEEDKSVTSSCTNHISVLQASPGTQFFKSGFEDSKSVTICNRCKPATIIIESENGTRGSKNLNMAASLIDTVAILQSQPKNKAPVFSRLFPRLKKKKKNEKPINQKEFEGSQIMSIESLKKELIEAKENKDAALMEVAEMKSSLGKLKQKLENLESYCEELKKGLRQSVEKSTDLNGESFMPGSHESMVEGFLQMASEARISVEQFCETLVRQVEETDDNLIEKINLLLQPHKLTLNDKNSKALIYHLEAVINQSLYQDFENCVFQKNGSSKILDPQQNRKAQFSSFVGLKNLSWNEVLRKGTKCYSEEFSKFCDRKMSCVISTLNWTRPWPEKLLHSFFVAAKCIWLLHLLACSFNPPLGILRVEENRIFDTLYMEDILPEVQRLQASQLVKIMVMPGFYVQDRVVRCKVLCRCNN